MEKPIEQYTWDELVALIGRPPEGCDADEWMPRDVTWHQERLNWIKETAGLRTFIQDLKDNGVIPKEM